MIHFYIKMYIFWVYNLIPLKAHMCRESISTTNTTCNFFFFSWTWTDAAGAPSFRKVLQSHKIPKAPPAQPISLFPVPQTLNFHIPALLTRSPGQCSNHPLLAPLTLAEASRRIPSSRPGTFSKSHQPCLVTHLSPFLCHPRVVAITPPFFTLPPNFLLRPVEGHSLGPSSEHATALAFASEWLVFWIPSDPRESEFSLT